MPGHAGIFRNFPQLPVLSIPRQSAGTPFSIQRSLLPETIMADTQTVEACRMHRVSKGETPEGR
ncbi:MAG: hypothetical protein LBU46_05390 [Candidatus Accumulibacter sp.]|nr:hypothetical protein [Accumulibacter sp.]